MKINNLILLFSLLALVSCSTKEKKEDVDVKHSKKINILLLVGDDMAFADIGPYGSEISTPVLDTLASEGFKFSNFHATPVCSVTRSELLTGNNSIEVGLGAFDYAVYPPAKGQPGYEGYLTRNTVTIAELLKDAGYHTYTTGKWHLGGTKGKGEGPNQWGFEKSYGIYVGGSNHWNQEVMLPDVKDPKVAKAIKSGGIPPIQQEKFYENGKEVIRPNGIYSNDLYTGKMLEYMNEDNDDGKPFFAYMAFTTAHFPIQAPQEYIDKYYDYYLEHGYESVKKKRFEMLKKHGVISEETSFPNINNPLVKPWDSLSQKEKEMQAKIFATYAGMIESQDHHIGKVIDYLKETNQYDNTLIIYMTDNGPEGFDIRSKFINNPLLNKWAQKNYNETLEDVGSGNTNWQIGTSWANAATGTLQWWKGFVSEGGIRVPMIMITPKGDSKRKINSTVNNFISVKEIPMTILDYAGVKHPKNYYGDRKIVTPSGISIKDFLEGKSDIVRTKDQMVAFELFGNKYVVSGNLKASYTRSGKWGPPGNWILYDIQNDPGETIALNEKYPKELKQMISFYENFAKKSNIVSVDDDWNPYSAVSH